MGVEAAAKQARTPQQRQQVLQIARRWALSPSLQMRWRVVKTLNTFSSPTEDEHLLLAMARHYADDFTLSALGRASLHALPALRALQADYPSTSAEYQDIAHAVQRLEQKSQPD
jgi:hypothetical protein